MLKETIGAASLLLATQGTAFAQEKLPDVTVPYGDLDLSNPADVRILDRRLGWAVRSACPDQRSVGGAKAMRACVLAKRDELAPLRAQALASVSPRGDAAVAAR